MQPHQQSFKQPGVLRDPDAEFIKEFISGKNVILIFCLDCIPLQGQEMMRQTRLHQSIEANCSALLEIDLDRREADHFQLNKSRTTGGIDTLKAFTDEVREIICSGKWDLIVLSDVLPFVENPIYFLKQLKEVYAPFVSEMIIRLTDFDKAIQLNHGQKYLHTPGQLSNQLFCFDLQSLQRVMKASGYKTVTIHPIGKRKTPKPMSANGINQLLGGFTFPNAGKNQSALFCRASF